MNDNIHSDNGEIIYVRWTFPAAMHQTSPQNKRKYSDIKNKFLSFRNADGKNIRNTEYRHYSIFYDGREMIARVTLRQNLLKIYFRTEDGETWTEYKLRTIKAQKEVLDLIDALASARGWGKRPRFKEVDYVEKFPTLSNVVLIKRRKKEKSADRTEREAAPAKHILEALDICSCEHTEGEDGALTPVLKNVHLAVDKGDILGLSGEDARQVTILCEIIANMRPYYKGFLRVGEIGSVQDKRSILSHTYYIDSSDMLYGRMTVLEQALFSVYPSRKRQNAAARQREILDMLVDNGLRNIALKRISELTEGERLLVCVFIAAVSESEMIIVNLTEQELSQSEIEMLADLTDLIEKSGKTAVFATMQPKLIGMACDKTAYLCNGTVEYSGTVERLVREWDKVACLIKGDGIEKWGDIISAAMPGYKCVVESGTLFVRNHNNEDFDARKLYAVLQQNGITPDLIKFNRGRVENSFEELTVRYDI